MYAGFFKKIKTATGKGDTCEGVLSRINKLEINMTIPLIFELFAAHQKERVSENELTECLSILENYLVRRIICGLPTNSLSKLFVGLALEVDKYTSKDHVPYIEAFKYAILSKQGKSRFPNDHDFRDKFSTYEMYNAKPYVRKYILERLENWNNREQIAVEEQIDDGTLTIEHIMPQTLTEEWKEALGMGWELTHTKYVDTLGNLTLSAYNSDYSNLSFLKKKNMPGKGFIHSKLQLNKYLKKLEKWDDEEFDFSNKRIIKMTLFGDEIATTDVTDAYIKIHSAVYDFDPAEYLRVINTVSDGGDIRCPYMVANGVYITTNISSQAKMANIQRLFEAFGFESKDLIFEVRDIPKALKFDISDEKTYCVLKVGELAKRLIGKALVDRRITEEEIALLHDKNYSKRLFPQNYYPVLADSVDAHRGKSKTTRYYKDPVIIDGREIFVSSQWFEDDRDNLLEWYRNHS